MRAGSLFSGIGGFDLGLLNAGIETAWMCEADAACRRLLERRFPGVPIYEDVRTIRADGLAAVDLLHGGFPCQDLSVAGRRAGLDGGRSGLWFEFARLASELHPEWVLVENVPGLLSSNGGRDFAVLVQGLVELGYGVAWRILDAQFFGVAQRRRRVFIVGSLRDAARAAAVLFEPESCAGDPAPGREARSRAATLSAGSPASPGVNRPGRRREDDVNLVSTLQGGGKRGYRVDAETAAGGGLVIPS
jgi:DNA (cytosine-5)-methyltransferase 1